MEPVPGNPASKASGGASVLARAPWWGRGVRNGVAMGILAFAAILLLSQGELPGLGRVLVELPTGIAISAAIHLPQILLTAIAWRCLLPAGMRPSTWVMIRLRWYREAANSLLPAGALLGQAAAARLLTRHSVTVDMAGATATVDMTLEAVSQLVFTLAGVALLLAGGADHALAGLAVAGLAIAATGAVAMVVAQRHLGSLERLLARRWPALRREWMGHLHRAVLHLHMDWRGLMVPLLWHGTAWALGAFEVMALLELLGQPVSLAEALVIESLAQALRNVGFMLPGALAAQEGAIVGAAALVGVPPAAALAVALVRRTREIAFALPGLVAWHRSETAGPRTMMG